MTTRLTGLRRLYDWTLRWAGHRHAALALFIISFSESSLFLVPPDVMLVPMVLARPRGWVRYAAITTAGSVIGGIFGYYIGIGLWESLGVFIVETYHLEDSIAAVQVLFGEHAFWAVFGSAFTPIPYKVFTIASGLFRVPLGGFIIASVLGRALRFFIIAGLVGICGERVKRFIDDYFDIFSIAALALLMGGFLVIRLLV